MSVRAIVCTHKRAEEEIERREREGKNVKKSDCGKGCVHVFIWVWVIVCVILH